MFCKIWSNPLRFIKLSLVVLATLLLYGCGYIYGDDGLIKSQEYDYVKARQSKPLNIPETLSHKGKTDYTVLPKIGKKGEIGAYGKNLVQTAPVQLLAVLDNVRSDKKSSVPAVFILDKLEFIWQTVTFFFKEHEIETDMINKDNQVIVSRWIAVEDKGIWRGEEDGEEPDLNRAKYKINILTSEIKGEYKLSVERIGSQSRLDDDEPWQDQEVTWQQSADMMNILLGFYDSRIRTQEARYQQKLMAGFKVELGQDTDGNAALLTEAKESLVWEKIPKVVRDLGFVIIDKDLRQKTYFMEYTPQEEGFFASLFGDEKTALPLEAGAYQITVAENGELRSLTLKDGQGDGITAEILVKLFPDLSRLFGDRR